MRLDELEGGYVYRLTHDEGRRFVRLNDPIDYDVRPLRPGRATLRTAIFHPVKLPEGNEPTPGTWRLSTLPYPQPVIGREVIERICSTQMWPSWAPFMLEEYGS